MYLVGGEHPNKQLAKAILERLVALGERLVTDAEVFQDILHRYTSIRRYEAIQPAFNVLTHLTDDVFPIDFNVVEQAKEALIIDPRLTARDAIHIEVMKARMIRSIVSFDSGFDSVQGIERIFS